MPAPVTPRPTLSNAEYWEGGRNRDPFRCLLKSTEERQRDGKRLNCVAKLPQYGLDELKLTGIIGGGARPRALFRGPGSATSTTVKRGDRIGKTCSQVTAILSDRVIVRIKLDGSARESERVIVLHGKT